MSKNLICVKCGQEIDGIICWKALKWSALRFFIWVVIWIPSLFFLQYYIGLVWALGIGFLVLVQFFILLCSYHKQTLRPGFGQWDREQKAIQEREFEKFIREYQYKIPFNN